DHLTPEHAPLGLRANLAEQGAKVRQVGAQTLSSAVGGPRRQPVLDLPGLAETRLSDLQQATVQCWPLSGCRLRGMHGGRGVDALGQLFGTACAVTKARLSRSL